MKKYTYPAVLYYDNEEKNYIIVMYDLALITSGETVEEACAVHGVDVDELIEKINDFIKDK